jgi:hypothetical protein
MVLPPDDARGLRFSGCPPAVLSQQDSAVSV